MFNLYKYLFLFIMNLSLAEKIESCSIFNTPGIYTVNEVKINGEKFDNTKIDITNPFAQLSYEIQNNMIYILYTHL